MKVWAMPVGHEVMPTSFFPPNEAAGAADGAGACVICATDGSTAAGSSMTSASAASMTALLFRIASAVLTLWIGLPAKGVSLT